MKIIGLLIAIYFLITGLYMLVMSFASFLFKPKRKSIIRPESTYAILIPAYKDDLVIINTVKKTLDLAYPQRKFDIYVIADQLKLKTLIELKKLPVHLWIPNLEKSTKVRSLQYAINNITNNYDYFIILDADNEPAENFLHEINFYHASYSNRVIQGYRASKNSEDLAVADGFSETANSFLGSMGPNAIGFSSRLSGSGISIPSATFIEAINSIDTISGFDKELELIFTKKGIQIDYLHEAVIYDEKVNNANQMGKQRARWLMAQYQFFFSHFLKAWKALYNGNTDYFHRVMQMGLPPRFLAPPAMALTAILGAFIAPSIAWISFLGFSTYLGAYLLILLRVENKKSVLIQILIKVPALLSAYLQSMTWLPKAKNTFLHTTKTTIR